MCPECICHINRMIIIFIIVFIIFKGKIINNEDDDCRQFIYVKKKLKFFKMLKY